MFKHELSAPDLELSAVEDGVSVRFNSTNKFKFMNYEEMMKSDDTKALKIEIKYKKERFNKFDVLILSDEVMSQNDLRL